MGLLFRSVGRDSMTYSLDSSKGGLIKGIVQGIAIGIIQGDKRNLDWSSYDVIMVLFEVVIGIKGLGRTWAFAIQ